MSNSEYRKSSGGTNEDVDMSSPSVNSFIAFRLTNQSNIALSRAHPALVVT